MREAMLKDDVLKSFDGKNALVTGGTGLIGREVVRMLCEAGASVRIVSLDQVQVHREAEHIIGDLTHLERCLEFTRDMDYVFHLAGIKGSAKVSTTMLATHFVPTLMMNTNVIEASRANGIQRLVYTSSIGAYTNTDVFREEDYRVDSEPMDFAGWAKRVAELQIHAYHVQHNMDGFAVVRPSNVYGPGDNFDPENAMVIPTLIRRIHEGENPVVVWGDGTAIRDFVFSRDVAEGIILALYHGTRGKFVNLGSGTEVTIRELLETLKSFLDFNYVLDPEKSSGYPKRVMNIQRAREWIDYSPSTSLQDGLRETSAWYVTHKDEFLLKKNYFV